jgi:uncharacterized 2Fe-2S/4Fe-4S cluster protein (DUF4445 family)
MVTATVNVRFEPLGIVATVPVGTTILQAARQAGAPVESPCNGAGKCAKCQVTIAPADRSRVLEGIPCDHSPATLPDGVVLACHARVVGDVAVRLPAAQRKLQVLSDGAAPLREHGPHIRKHYDPSTGVTSVLAGGRVIATEVGDTTALGFAAAIDIGTTTLVVALIDLANGQELSAASSLNPQTLYGHDVLSRIRFASQGEGLATMQRTVVGELNSLLLQAAHLAGVKTDNIYEAVLSGNTCMLHLVAGADVSGLGKYPYAPALRGGNHLNAATLGLAISPQGLAYLPPIISGFVGADITSGILATDLARLSGVTLLVDIGTNGEMVLSVDGHLTATSTAAGPAFEGVNIAAGMRASSGAIEVFEIDGQGEISTRTIADAPPVGICGSGLLDIVGELAAWQILDANGRFVKEASHLPDSLRRRVVAVEGKPAFEVAAGIRLTQKDVRQVQLAKGAIRAGIDVMLSSNALSPADIDRVLIAGAFGYHLRTLSLVRIGLLPPALADKVHFVGNTSKTGAAAFATDESARSELAELVKRIDVIELANSPGFEKVFVQSLALGK